MAREAWTDERLDDLTHRVDDGFNRNEREFQAVRLEMRTEFQAVRAEMGTESQAIRTDLGGQIAALHRTIVQIAAGGLVTMLVGFAGVIATQL
jgi:aspartate ammonia-lyase